MSLSSLFQSFHTQHQQESSMNTIQYGKSDRHDLIENPSPRCACMLVLDVSGSMDGQPIQELNEGLREFLVAVGEDDMAAYSVEVGIITAGGRVSEVLPFTTAHELQSLHPLNATGSTPLGGAVELALLRLDERKEEYKRNGVSYFQPWLVIISDGSPTDAWQGAAAQARDLSLRRKLVVMPIGVQGADLGTLGQFTTRSAVPLNGLKFREFFEWLSQSMSNVSNSGSTHDGDIKLGSIGGWASI